MKPAVFLLSLIIGTCFWPIHSKTLEEKGLDIAKKNELANNDFLGETSEMKMVLIDSYGTKITRIMKGMVKEVSKDGDKSLITFIKPNDVKGTKMLTWSHKEGDNDQWLYLPSLRRVKRISSRNKSSSFMGSEFSYEDLGSQELEKYKHKFLKEEKKEGFDVWVLERIPTFKSGYSKQIIYIIKNYHNPIIVEYFDRRGGKLKTAYFKDYKSYNVKGKTIWRASSIHMKNHQNKKESIFFWENRKLGVEISTRKFSKNSLK